MSYVNTVEQELNDIRVKLYEETKGMSIEERIAYFKKLTAPINEEFNIHPISSIPVSKSAHAS